MAWRIAVDVGGTFTDLVAVDEETGAREHLKVLSTPAEPARAFLDTLHQFAARHPGAGISSVAHATTLGSNVLLGRGGSDTGALRISLVTTEGFRDLIEIGRQNRPELYNFFFEKPRPLVPRPLRFTVAERLAADGEVVTPLNEAGAHAVAKRCREEGVAAVAVCFLHSYANPAHEREMKAILAEEAPGLPVVLSSDVNPEYREYERTSTTVINALLMPVLSAYFTALHSSITSPPTPDSRSPIPDLLVMTSAGGLASVEEAVRIPAATLESGPAAGVVAAAFLARQLNLPKVLTLDMGGTTAKAGRILNGTPLLTYGFEVGGRVHAGRFLQGSGYPVRYPALDLAEVSAGGGSLVRKNAAGQVEVGPESAGAEPGPICYDRGGVEPTITDANFVLGRLSPDDFLGGSMRLNFEKARAALEVPSAADAIRLANSQMAKALRIVSAERGEDPAGFALIAFGGAGPMHACELAEELNISTVIIPPHPGLFSASGLLTARPEVHLQASYLRPLSNAKPDEIEAVFLQLENEALLRLPSCSLERKMGARYRRQSYELTLPWEGLEVLRAQFDAAHRVAYGFASPDAPIEIVNLRVTGSRNSAGFPVETHSCASLQEEEQGQGQGHGQEHGRREEEGTHRIHFNGQFLESSVIPRSSLDSAQSVTGPALISEYDSTTVIPPGWTATPDAAGNLLLSRVPVETSRQVGTSLPGNDVEIGIFSNALATIAEEMGVALKKSAYSPNIKERADHSCAIFDAEGRLLAAAEHIPVHLGSFAWGMRQTLTAMIHAAMDFRPGDIIILNDPYLSGTHLNDVMLIRPVFLPKAESASPRLIAFVANKAHHVDVGGKFPGGISMSAESLEEEGIVIPPTYLMRNGELDASFLSRLKSAVRLPDFTEGDLRAQIAACLLGERRLLQLLEPFNRESIEVLFDASLNRTEERTRAELRKLPEGMSEGFDVLDLQDEGLGHGQRFDAPRSQGSKAVTIRVWVAVRDGRFAVDFSGTSPQLRLPLNAVFGVATAAAAFVLKSLLPPSIPVNDGFLRCLEVHAPEGSLVNPRSPAPVAAGNLETSQRIVDAILKALANRMPAKIPAAACGSMNNVIVSGENPDGTSWAFYETNGGGYGGRAGSHGPSAVQAHMTNTMNTPIEVLERDFPIRFLRYEIRENSGGDGRWPGGDGIVRAWKLLARYADVTLLADRVQNPPYGLAGGRPGTRAEFSLIHEGQFPEPLSSKTSFEIQQADVFLMETAGGGGYG